MSDQQQEQPLPEHHYRCEHCGELVDMRELWQVFSHDLIDKETQRNYCMTAEEREALKADLPPITARLVGESIEYRDGKPTHLN